MLLKPSSHSPNTRLHHSLRHRPPPFPFSHNAWSADTADDRRRPAPNLNLKFLFIYLLVYIHYARAFMQSTSSGPHHTVVQPPPHDECTYPASLSTAQFDVFRGTLSLSLSHRGCYFLACFSCPKIPVPSLLPMPTDRHHCCVCLLDLAFRWTIVRRPPNP